MRLWQALLAITALWATIYLPGLGGPELKGEEGRRILPGLAMLESGEWVVPSMEGQPYLRKPPLYNWAVVASVRATGRVNEFTARLPSVTCVLLLALGGGVLLASFVAGPGARPADRAKAAFLTGALLLVHSGLLEKGRLAELEAMFTSLSGLGMALWMMLWRQEAPKWLTWTLPGVWLGVAMLCKGPTHYVFFYAVVVATLKRDRSLRELLHPAHFAGLAVAWGIFALWAVPFRQRVASVAPDLDAGSTWVQQLTSRLGFESFNLADWLLSPVDALVMFLPWMIVIVVFWRKLPAVAAKLGGRDEALVLGLRTGVLVSVVAILLVPETRARFVQPVTLPMLALAAVLLWHALPEAWSRRWTHVSVALMAVLTAGGILAPFFVPALRAQGYNAAVAAMATVAASLGVWRLWVKFRRVSQPVRLVLATSLCAVLVGIIHAATVVPALKPHDNCRPVGLAIRAEAGGAPVAIFNPGRNPVPLHWRFYLGGNHTVVGRLSEVPPEARRLVAALPTADDPVFLDRIRNQLGFHREVLRLKDSLNYEYVVWTRDEAGASGEGFSVGRPGE